MKTMTAKLSEELAVATSTKERLAAKLAEAATDGTESRGLMSLVEAIANAEGQESTYALFSTAAAYAVKEGEDVKATVLDAALRLLEAGADDNWSGRGNDVRRARFDGVREAVRDVRFL